ncbi:conjugal transfer protein TraN [Erythrobacter litoralis]|uniref:Conjugal transfer protein TraN n=1 Tax=Erythrobacter litoralis (strain HTCC2594) TaxID=314225 RepID=Q2N5J1_ERYLH|nr:hypothetical protein ELI_14790 [Erythrobacter litoralis HTCC2594]
MMHRLLLKAAALAACLVAAPVAAQQQDAKEDGKSFGQSLRGDAQRAAQTPPEAADLPNYEPNAVRDLERLADNPDRIESSAAAAATTHQGYRAMRDSIANRARFDSEEIEDVIARSLAINETPLDYTSGMSVTGSQGACVPLPPGSASAGTYTATCNSGTRIEQSAGQCTVPLIANVSQRQQWHYLCNDTGGSFGHPWCSAFDGNSCRITGYRPGPCLQWRDNQFTHYCTEPGDPIAEISCDAPDNRFTPYAVTTDTEVDTALDESQCTGLGNNADCALETEICTDSFPQTRIIDGVSVSRSCWEWQRSYSCVTRSAASDCAEIEDQGTCRFLREECLTDGTPCETWERIYECPLPAGDTGTTQYVCDGDVYCIDGSCETIERNANDEFKDAVTALHAMDEARGAFDPDTLTLFRGTRNTCSSKVFGVLNCCKGKGFPLIPGISLLVALGCDREEVLLHERDAQGLCAYAGTYCSKKFLGVCLTKKKAYCCFESKLSRILQEQGRKQLPKPWDKPREEQCEGFTLDEFAQLDLSQMDFSEVYAEFTEAARLPDELETSVLIQQKIEDYYARSGQ